MTAAIAATNKDGLRLIELKEGEMKNFYAHPMIQDRYGQQITRREK